MARNFNPKTSDATLELYKNIKKQSINNKSMINPNIGDAGNNLGNMAIMNQSILKKRSLYGKSNRSTMIIIN